MVRGCREYAHHSIDRIGLVGRSFEGSIRGGLDKPHIDEMKDVNPIGNSKAWIKTKNTL